MSTLNLCRGNVPQCLPHMALGVASGNQAKQIVEDRS